MTCMVRLFLGSPPPMRGKVGDDLRRNVRIRITPAYAGKSDVSRMSFPIYEDHPRLCGEKFEPCPHRQCNNGSPPPMRGKVTYTALQNILPWITPAYAGKRAESL